MRRRLAHLRRNTAGNIATFFALSAMGLTLMVGLAIDINRYVSVRNQVQEALDAAALGAAASRAQTVKELEAVSGPYLEANLKTCLLYTSPSPRDQRGSRMPSSA